MSKRNTLEGKSNRRIDRKEAGYLSHGIGRELVSDMPGEAAVQLLTGGEKLTRGIRKSIMAARGVIILRERKEPRDLAVKNLIKLRGLPLVRVLRERTKAAHRAATFMYKAQKSELGTKIRAVFEQGQHGQLAYLKQVKAELQVRAAF